MIKNSDYLKTTFPEIIETIKSYISLDKDFRRLCSDFEELSELIFYLEKSDVRNFDKMKTQLSIYKQLRATLISEIYNFILEEKLNN